MRQLLNYVSGNIFAPKTLRNTIWYLPYAFRIKKSSDAKQTLYV